MKKLILANMVIAIAIIVFAVLDLLFLFVLGYPSFFLTLMPIAAIIFAALGALIGWQLKSKNIVFEDNFISKHLGGISRYFNDFSTAIAGLALLAATFVIGYINVLTIGAALYTILTSYSFLTKKQ